MAQLLGGMEGVHWAGLVGVLVQVALIDLTLASDNAVAVGMVAAGLPQPQRRQAIVLGLGGAVVLLCGLAFFAVSLLKWGGGGLVAGGGMLLLLISWQMWRDLRRGHHGQPDDAAGAPAHPHRTLLGALIQIFLADVSTSLDNVLAVAGVVRNQPPWVLFAGLALSVVLTGLAAVQVARLLRRWPWIGYIGVIIVVFVAGRMVWDGAESMGWLHV
ncbi:MAG TPA: YjbE family putative metal transport protein [Caulobacteraceae bacterium]|jgi:YjbE family integral membrane protein